MAAFPTCFEASKISTAATLVHLLEIPSNMAYATIQISALNDGLTTAGIKIAIAPSNLPAAVTRVNYIETKDEIKPGGVYSRFGLIVKGGCSVFIQASTNDVIFRGSALAHELAV